MTFWTITSWICVGILTGVNIFVFMKLKGASEQMMKMAFPNAKNMGDAMGQMQKMMQGFQGGNMGRGGFPKAGGNPNSDAQLKAAMEMLNKLQKR